jgi:hypothetical protein
MHYHAAVPRLRSPRGLSVVALMMMAAVGCGTTGVARPLGRGRAAVQASLGGPIVGAFGTFIPTPILTVGGAYGVSDRVAATGGLDVTAAVYGVAHVTGGAAAHPLVSAGGAVPTVGVAASVHLLTNVTDTRVAPQATAVAAWRVGGGGRHLVYGGADAGVVFGEPTRILAGPLLGGELRLSHRWGLGLELKWLAPHYDVEPLAPDWLSPGRRGYFTVLFGLRRYLGEVP